MILYDDGEVGKAIEPHFVETHVGDGLHIYEDRTQVGDIVFITTDKFKKYIHIEWLMRKADEWATRKITFDGKPVTFTSSEVGLAIAMLVKEWEKENETN